MMKYVLVSFLMFFGMVSVAEAIEIENVRGLVERCGADLSQCELQADGRNIEAVFALGSIYDKGYVVTQDKSKAAEYYKVCAQENISLCQYILGMIYMERNKEAEALSLFQKAASYGHDEAESMIKVILYETPSLLQTEE